MLQQGQSHFLTPRFLVSLFIYPHTLQIWELAKNLSTLTICLSYQFALYSSCLTNSDHDTSAILLASLWFFIIFFIWRSSIQIISFSLISSVDNFCRKSFLWLAIFSCWRAIFILALLRFELPFGFRDSFRCSLTSLANDFLRYLGFSIILPSDVIQNSLIPKSNPTEFPVRFNGLISTSVQQSDI